MQGNTERQIASLIDHTILKADASALEIEKYCAEAIQHGFCSVVVNPIHVRRVADALGGTNVRTASVIGFPLGGNVPALKVKETESAFEQGADEIDVVIDLGAMADGRYADVESELRAVRKASEGKIMKVIIEACLLTDEGTIAASSISAATGADLVKTSTGFSSGGATVEDIALIRRTVGPEIGIKASGGIRTRETALRMLDAGATRIGSSVGPLLLQL